MGVRFGAVENLLVEGTGGGCAGRHVQALFCRLEGRCPRCAVDSVGSGPRACRTDERDGHPATANLLQQRVGAGWANKGAAPLRAGRLATKVQPATVGTFRYRIFYPGDSHKPSAAGFSLTVT